MATSRLDSNAPDVSESNQSECWLFPLTILQSGQIAESPDTSSPRTQLRSHCSDILDAISVFPPVNIAYFLVDTFLDAAQTNYTYVDEQTLRKRLDSYYSGNATLDTEDSPWICTALMVFAVATQFTHLKAGSGCGSRNNSNVAEMQSTDESIALRFYHKAIKLLPDVLGAANLDSVQASLLLSVYTLPIDADGLTCTYVGIAIRIATQNGMHLKYHRSLRSRQLEVRRRIWWSAYSLERHDSRIQMYNYLLTSSADDFAYCMEGRTPSHAVILRLIYRKSLQKCAVVIASRHLRIS